MLVTRQAKAETVTGQSDARFSLGELTPVSRPVKVCFTASSILAQSNHHIEVSADVKICVGERTRSSIPLDPEGEREAWLQPRDIPVNATVDRNRS